MKKNIVIAMDGPSGAGKSTVSDLLAIRLGLHHLDSGALFRAVALKVIRAGGDCSSESAVLTAMEPLQLHISLVNGAQCTILDGKDVSQFLRTQEVGQGASSIGVFPRVRAAITERVREIAKGCGIIVDGRDIGTVMLPDADYKFYLDASPKIRTQRRAVQLDAMGETDIDMDVIEAEIRERDIRDSQREVAPLKKAEDAIYIDSTELSVDEVVISMLSYISCGAGI